MKLVCILLFGILLQLTTYAQQTGSKLYLINFRDKGLNKSMLSDPAQFLSAKAIDRRSRHHVAIDETDLPLNERYVNAVVSKGAHILASSRWFNYVLVESRATDPSAFASIPGVSRVRQLNDKKRVTAEWPAVKPYFSAESFAPYAGGFRKSSEANVYDYGAAANQINMIKGEFLHNLGYSGQGMTIAQLDAGFNSVDVMAAFDSLRVNNQILGTKNFVHPSENVYSTSINSHGTMVLSTMAANIQGVMVGTAPKASFWLLRTEDADSEYITEEYFWVNAAEFADSVGADIINSSLGYTQFDDPQYNHTYADMDGNTTHITIGADMAAQKGILVVNSAGNSGADAWKYIGAPADGDSVFTIGAVDAYGVYAYFSSKGPTYDRRIKPTISAQGQGSAVFSPGGLGYGSGTSFSSPIIAGMSACLWQSAPSLNNMSIIAALTATSSKSANPDTLVGWGIPDYSAAYGVLGTANLEKFDGTSGIKAFPNPFSDHVTIELNKEINGILQIAVSDLSGRIIKQLDLSGQLPSRQIRVNSLGSLPAGIYILRVQSDEAVYSTRIARQ